MVVLFPLLTIVLFILMDAIIQKIKRNKSAVAAES
jgi:hypothetical protein